MAQEHDLTIRFQAEDLYVDDRLTYEETAERLGVGLNTVKRWGADGDWKTLRHERLEQKRTIKHNLYKLREKMMSDALASGDPQTVFAAMRLEKLALDREKKTASGEPDIDRPKMFLEDLEFMAGVLKEIDPEGLKVLARSFDTILRRFKEQHAQTA